MFLFSNGMLAVFPKLYKLNPVSPIAVKIEDKNMSLLGFIELKQKLEDALEKKVDLVEYSVIKPLIKNSILNEEIKII